MKQLQTMGLLFAAGAAFVLLQTPIASAKEGKIGYINLSQVFDAYKKTKDYDKELEGEAESKRKERDSLVASIKKLREEIELLSEDKRAQKQAEIDEKVRNLQAFDRDARQVLRQKRDNMLREILKEIDAVVKTFGDVEGYEYILDSRLLLYKNESSDLSEKIIKKLNDKQ